MTGNLDAPGLTAAQVAERLGVRVQTVYAYVSRGQLTRTVDRDGRTSRFDPVEVEVLARRGRPRSEARRSGSIDVVLSSAITDRHAGRFRYRGHDVVELVRTATFESVAELLWDPTGRRDPTVAPPPWEARVAGRERAAAVADAIGTDAPSIELLAAATAAVAATEPLRIDLHPDAVAAQARNLLSVLVEALPLVGPRPEPVTSRRMTARRLWPRLSPLSPSRPRVRTLDAALILLADHELATSTLAARVAASTRAAPHAVVLAGLGVASGPSHGRAAIRVHQLLADASGSGDAEAAVARALTGASSEASSLPGFGHPVHGGADPRATCLLERLDPLLSSRNRAAIDEVRDIAARTTPLHPNIDFALGALAHVAQMPVGRSEAVFAIARTAGWIAHAIEECAESPLRFRPRALYTGP
jgi:citrate synthase